METNGNEFEIELEPELKKKKSLAEVSSPLEKTEDEATIFELKLKLN